MEKNQGHLEHANQPGISIDTFSQYDLNKGLVLYHAPKKIGIYPIEFSFTFIVMNDNRSDTFPETPFHIKVSPSNDQAPFFKLNTSPPLNLNISEYGSLSLSRDLFDFEDPDTPIDNIFFSIENPSDNYLIELRIKDKQRYIITKTDMFTIQEIRDGTFRLIHKGGVSNDDDDLLKISVSDGKHISFKQVYLNVLIQDKQAPRLETNSSLYLNIKEDETKLIKREHLAFVDDKSLPNEIIYELLLLKTNLIGKLYLNDVLLLKPGNVKFSQADIDAKLLKYVAPQEIGPTQITDLIYFSVKDKENNLLRDQLLTINIEPIDNQSPLVETLFQPAEVNEGSYLILNESYIKVTDSDSPREQLNIIIDVQPQFGYIMNNNNNNKLNSFTLKDLNEGKFIRYVQSEHENKEPSSDSFIFHASDGVNESPTYKFFINILPVNDEPPLVLFNALLVDYNSNVYLSNSTLYIFDLDTSATNDLLIYVEEFPNHGKLYLNNKQITRAQPKFTYSDVLQQRVSYKLESETNEADDIKFRITDGNFSVVSTFYIKKILTNSILLEPPPPPQQDNQQAPIITQNNGLQIKLNDQTTQFITKTSLDVKDDDTSLKNLKFYIINQPKLGKLENILQPESQVTSFTYEDLEYNRLKYIINKDKNATQDLIDIRISDGKNEITTSLQVTISQEDTNNNNNSKYTILKSILALRCKQFERKKITSNEINMSDDLNLKIIITNPPQYGILEKVNNHTYTPVNEFTMADIKSGLISYRHIKNGFQIDRFGFLVSDGVNANIFVLENSNQVSTVQIFTIYIDSKINLPPKIEKNLGIDYLQLLDNSSTIGRLIAKNDLLITDQDDLDSDILIEIQSQPKYGILMNKNFNHSIERFTQEDLNQNKIYYIFTKENQKNDIQNDYFYFNVIDSAKNEIKQQRFDVKWSIVNFDQSEISVYEEDGRARVHIKKEGNLKRFSMVTCKTISDTAKSNKDIKNFDFVFTTIKLEFNEDESYKACDIIIQKDSIIEIPMIESFYVVLEDPIYSILGLQSRVKVNILDKKQKENIIEFEQTRFDVNEMDKFISIPIVRSAGGDLSVELQVECVTKDETAIQNLDYLARNKHGADFQLVKIPPGETYGFCDIEIVDDDLHEFESETFKIWLRNPSLNTKIGSKSEAIVSITGPNDFLLNTNNNNLNLNDNCKTVFYTVSENSNQISFELNRDKLNSALESSLDVLVRTTTQSSQNHIKTYFDYYKKIQMNEIIENQNNLAFLSERGNNFTKTFITVPSNISLAIPEQDYVTINEVVRFMPGESTKVIINYYDFN